MKKAIISLSLVLALGLTACGGAGTTPSSTDSSSSGDLNSTVVASSSSTSEKPTVLKIGVVGENNEQWDYIKTELAKENVDLQLVKFADYSLPNQALADGEIDLNAFQHYAFLEKDIESRGLDLTVIGETLIAPLGIYSSSITDLEQLSDGDKVAIPSDATNGGRALILLQSAGLIEVDPSVGYLPEKKDITSNPKNLEIIEVEAAQTPGLLPDVAIAVINGGHATDNGLSPLTDSLYLEQVVAGSDNPYINIIVARTADVDNPLYKHVVELYQTDEVATIITDAYQGAFLPAWTTTTTESDSTASQASTDSQSEVSTADDTAASEVSGEVSSEVAA